MRFLAQLAWRSPRVPRPTSRTALHTRRNQKPGRDRWAGLHLKFCKQGRCSGLDCSILALASAAAAAAAASAASFSASSLASASAAAIFSASRAFLASRAASRSPASILRGAGVGRSRRYGPTYRDGRAGSRAWRGGPCRASATSTRSMLGEQHREDALHAFAVGNLADGEALVRCRVPERAITTPS